MKLFLPQTTLEEWATADQADICANTLVLLDPKASYPINSAVHFLQVVSGSDVAGLLSKVKTQAQLRELGAEHLLDSVILGETAYEVAPGYVTELATQTPNDPRQGSTEAQLLAAFLLGKG